MNANTKDRVLTVADTLLLTVRREPRWRVLGIRIGTKGYTVAVRKKRGGEQ